MIYAYDQAMQMPVKDLYDTQIMAMAINAAKDMYEKGQKQLDDFHKLYGDFFSPIGKDMENYNNLVLNPVRDAVNEIYAIGGDPIRSPEGRAALARIIRNVPIGDVNELKQSAETAKIYQKALAEAIAKGYDPDVDKFFNPVGLDEWDTLKMGTWNRPAPTTIKTIKEATNDWFDKRTAHDLTPEQMRAEGYAFNPIYDYTGFLYNDLLETAGKMTPGWQSSLEAKYYRAQAKKQLEAAGKKDITPEMIEAQLQRNVAEANREYIIKPNKKANEFALDNHRTANDIKAAREKAAIEDKYDAIKFFRENPDKDPRNYDSEGTYIGPSYSGIGNGDRTIDGENHNYFTEATGIANLFTPGGGGTIVDFDKNFKQWGDRIKTVEDDIAKEVAEKKWRDGKYIYYQGAQPHKWIRRHTVPYDGALMADFFHVPAVEDVNGEKDGKTIYVSETIRKNMITEEELGSRNINSTYSKIFTNRQANQQAGTGTGIKNGDLAKYNGNALRRAITFGQNYVPNNNSKSVRTNIPLATSTDETFHQVEKDGRIHHYCVVKLKYAGQTRKMYIDMGLTSEQGGLAEDASNFNRNRSRDMSATMPNSASKASAYEATHK